MEEARQADGQSVRAVVNALHAEQPQPEHQAPAASKKRKGDSQSSTSTS